MDKELIKKANEHNILMEMESSICNIWETKKDNLSPLHRWLMEEAALACLSVMEKYSVSKLKRV